MSEQEVGNGETPAKSKVEDGGDDGNGDRILVVCNERMEVYVDDGRVLVGVRHDDSGDEGLLNSLATRRLAGDGGENAVREGGRSPLDLGFLGVVLILKMVGGILMVCLVSGGGRS